LVLRDDDTASQNHFKIGEVAELVGVRPHVLRYWEQEFPGLRPKKTRGAHRHYSRANVALAKTIHALVVEQGYSIAGARKKLLDGTRAGASATTVAGVADSVAKPRTTSVRDELLAVRDELYSILSLLDEPEAGDAEDRSEAPHASRTEALEPAAVHVTRESVRRR
jgi:DNA-binding transcriptional MerR regulator